MARMLAKTDIATIVDMLKLRQEIGGQTVLFLGARAGGLYENPLLYENLAKFSPHNFSKLSSLERFHESYYRLKEFPVDDRHLLLLHALKKRQREMAHSCLAELLKQRLFSLVITTNIDAELEKAFTSAGLQEIYDYDLYIPDRVPATQVGYADKKFSLVKVFGDIATRRYELSHRWGYIEKHQDIRDIMKDARHQNMLMIGLDQVWDEHCIQYLFPYEGSLWYVNEDLPEENTPLFERLYECGARCTCIQGPAGNYDRFLDSLYSHITGANFHIYQTESHFYEVAQGLADGQSMLSNAVAQIQKNQQAILQFLHELQKSQQILADLLQQQEKQRVEGSHSSIQVVSGGPSPTSTSSKLPPLPEDPLQDMEDL
ncbi:MAG: hypothetical protein H0W02_03135 [Ktedonobacteraceae bacterium]|nr:hypothetical protein [Ktedonobacteraceae bacterium]